MRKASTGAHSRVGFANVSQGTEDGVQNPKGTGLADGPSGKVPSGDVRMTANIRSDLHVQLKIAAAQGRTTIGELIEELVQRHLSRL